MFNIIFVILHYQNIDDTINCIDSIKKLQELNNNYKILLVDNKSPNNTGKELEKIYINDSNIEITINDSNKFRSYEVYNITVRNLSDRTILLSPGSNGNDICLTDTNDVEYDSIINEIPLISLELAPGAQRTIDIRFYKMYNLYREIDRITFKNIILDKESYQNDPNNAEITSITIDI